ncbi:protein of unknown function [Paenibacillus tianmuensis]|uniref:DUF1877 domain-containing protein n=1 Tax=Paenibacillus tianmuensis TaxID=624147 RepID=A0A1G4PHJ1_9BACL|nr:YfbM family protein [Paenibacillus tianmuensis]SCW31754.1 protein of unknown function [Paenibacillus tianmuensis]
MSMIGNYCKITKEQFDLLYQNKIAVSEFLYSDGGHLSENDKLDIDKAWDIINFVLTGQSMMNMGEHMENMNNLPPIFHIVLGGKEISNEDIGYGSARYLTNQEVKECYLSIKGMTKEDFQKRSDIEKMLENVVHPLMEDEDGEEVFEYSYHHFEALQSFFEQASSEDKYMLLYIN